MSPETREQLEAHHTFRRLVELELNPVQGNFDVVHLKEINRRIFQDLPGNGMPEITPGKFRVPVPQGKDWMKNRSLQTVDGAFFVAYSPMDQVARTTLDRTLNNVDPEKLGALKIDAFRVGISALYVELDYIHPFCDVNSRTLRTFTRQLAAQAGYALDWGKFNQNPTGRDLLYIARDRSVNDIALKHVQDEQAKRQIVYTMDRLESNRALPDLLRDVIRPARVAAFENLSGTNALQAHPELAPAYETLHAAAACFQSKIADTPASRQVALKTVRDQIQDRLNASEPVALKKNPTLSRTATRPGSRDPSGR